MNSELCHLCHLDGENLIEIYGEQGKDLDILGILKKHFWFLVSILLHLLILFIFFCI